MNKAEIITKAERDCGGLELLESDIEFDQVHGYTIDGMDAVEWINAMSDGQVEGNVSLVKAHAPSTPVREATLRLRRTGADQWTYVASDWAILALHNDSDDLATCFSFRVTERPGLRLV